MKYHIEYNESITGTYYDTMICELKIEPNNNEAKSITIRENSFDKILSTNNIAKLTQLYYVPICHKFDDKEVVFYYGKHECGRITAKEYKDINELKSCLIDILKHLEAVYAKRDALKLKTRSFSIDIEI